MRRKTTLTMFSCFCFGASTILILFVLAKRDTHQNNSFIRSFAPDAVRETRAMDITLPSYYIAGGTAHHIYLGNEKAALHLLVANAALTDTQHVQLAVENPEDLKQGIVRVSVDSPHFYMTDGALPAALKGDTKTWLARRYLYDSTYFTEAVPISPSSLAIKSVSNQTHEYMLGKQSTGRADAVFVPSLLEKQVDGIFCVDGRLHYNRDRHELVYVYTYRNQYVGIDTNMHLLYRGNTIDTISRAQVKAGRIASQHAYTLTAPPLVVNKHSCVSGDWLFVHSNLMAKNEDPVKWERTSVIDVYDLNDTMYRFSFYLRDRDGKKMKSFAVFGKTLFALYGQYIVTYDLSQEYFTPQPGVYTGSVY